jgi:uncharacterized protein YndB with AHSA1/START domain
MTSNSTTISLYIHAPREAVYQALLDAQAVATWMVPDGMTSRVHAFEPREGGAFRISLTYDNITSTGKTSAHTDTYHGYFASLIPNEKVVEVMEFESADPAMQGQMTITFSLTAEDNGTHLHAAHDNVPPGISSADNETGWRMALDKLARLVENR